MLGGLGGKLEPEKAGLTEEAVAIALARSMWPDEVAISVFADDWISGDESSSCASSDWSITDNLG